MMVPDTPKAATRLSLPPSSSCSYLGSPFCLHSPGQSLKDGLHQAAFVTAGRHTIPGIIGIVLLVATRVIETYKQVLGNYQSGADVIIDDNDRLCF